MCLEIYFFYNMWHYCDFSVTSAGSGSVALALHRITVQSSVVAEILW